MRTERTDPGDAQLCSGHVLFLRNVGQGVDDSKIVLHRLIAQGEFRKHSIFHTESYLFLESREMTAEITLCAS